MAAVDSTTYHGSASINTVGPTINGFTLASGSAMDSLRIPGLDESNNFLGRVRVSGDGIEVDDDYGFYSNVYYSSGWKYRSNGDGLTVYVGSNISRFSVFTTNSGGAGAVATEVVALQFANSTGAATFASTLRTADTIRAGDWTTYSYFIPGGSLVTSSDSATKTGIVNAAINLANFKGVVPREYRFRKENFLRQFDESSVPDSIDVRLNDSVSVWQSNRSAKDSARADFYYRNNQWAERMSQAKHNGFLAQEFNRQLLGVESKEIRQEDINVALWLKVQELEKRIEQYEAKR